jgi:hypothetical protein
LPGHDKSGESGSGAFSFLIEVKDDSPGATIFEQASMEVAMPADSILVSTAVVSVFAVFAAVLAWASVHAPGSRQPTQQVRRRRPF